MGDNRSRCNECANRMTSECRRCNFYERYRSRKIYKMDEQICSNSKIIVGQVKPIKTEDDIIEIRQEIDDKLESMEEELRILLYKIEELKSKRNK